MLDIRWDKLFPPGYHPTKKKLFYMKGILIDYDDPEARNRGIFEVGGDISDEEKSLGHVSELGSAVLAFILYAVLVTMRMALAWSIASGGMYERLYPSGKRILKEGFIAKPLNVCLHGCLSPLVIIIAACIVIAVIHYAYFRRGSMSIYVMKRVRSPLEIHVRCLALPIMLLAAALIVSAVMILIFISYYYAHIPTQCLPAQNELNIAGMFHFVTPNALLNTLY